MKKSKKETFENIIIDILQNNPEAHLPFDVLQNILKVDGKKDNQHLKDAINSLYDRNLIVKRKGGAVQLSPNGSDSGKKDRNTVVGKMDISRRGTGYLIAEGFDEDIRVTSKHLGTALQDDTVKVKLLGKKGRKPERKSC